MKQKKRNEKELEKIGLERREKAVLEKVIAMFRDWYASISIEELTRNRHLIREIDALEGLLRGAMAR